MNKSEATELVRRYLPPDLAEPVLEALDSEFRQADLILLDLAVMERWGRTTRLAPPESEASGDDKLLWQHIRKLELLHQRLDALIEQAQE